jgi:hypothetical protein
MMNALQEIDLDKEQVEEIYDHLTAMGIEIDRGKR